MIITLYFIQKDVPPEHQWFVDIPQLVTHVFGPTRDAARKEALQAALENLAHYFSQGRFTAEEVREVQFVEVDTQMTAQERSAFLPRWLLDATRNTNPEAHAAE